MSALAVAVIAVACYVAAVALLIASAAYVDHHSDAQDDLMAAEPEQLYDQHVDTPDWRAWADEMPPGLVERCQRAVHRELNRQKGGA